MTRASASNTNTDPKPIRPIRDPSIEAPTKVQRTDKQPGSKVLKLGRWYEVQPDGELTPIE